MYCLAHSLHYDLGIPVRKVPEMLKTDNDGLEFHPERHHEGRVEDHR